MRKILVTGGCGFIGSHLIDYIFLKEPNSHIFCLDNLLTGSLENINHHIAKENFTLIKADVSETEDINLDQIYNLACPASPIHYQKDPIATLKTSVLGSMRLSEIAIRNKARIFHASTSEVYGDPHVHPQKEEYWGNVNPIGIRSCYDEGKRVAETILFDYKRIHNLDIRVARIFNTYGPRMDRYDGRAVCNFITQALEGNDITIYGDGSQTRSFCYIGDLIRIIYRFMNSENDYSGPLNIGNPQEYKIIELAERIIHKTLAGVELSFKDLPDDDPKQRQPDISLATNLYKWKPMISLDEGLDLTIPYFSNLLGLEK